MNYTGPVSVIELQTQGQYNSVLLICEIIFEINFQLLIYVEENKLLSMHQSWLSAELIFVQC